MSRLQKSLFTLAAALCALVATTHAHKVSANAPTFLIQGRVYCDTCRAGFETTVTEYIEGAKVKLECRNGTTHEVLHTIESVTDKIGAYEIRIKDDRQEEICEVVLVESPLADCSEIKAGRDRARILLTDNSGLASNIRFANSLSFLKSEPLPICGGLLMQYGLNSEED